MQSELAPLWNFAARSHVGEVRTNNEDSFVATSRLLAVADGVGGRPAGEVASHLAVSVLKEVFERFGDLEAGIQIAHRAVKEAAASSSLLHTMCSTLTAAAIDGDKLRIAHVGDTRVYMLREGKLEAMTEDQNVVNKGLADGTMTKAEAESHANPRRLVQAVGSQRLEDLDVWFSNVEVRPGDRLLMATDGLEYAGLEAITEILKGEADPERAAESLVAAARAKGAPDNVTVIVADVADRPS